jgi:hypothetical protein
MTIAPTLTVTNGIRSPNLGKYPIIADNYSITDHIALRGLKGVWNVILSEANPDFIGMGWWRITPPQMLRSPDIIGTPQHDIRNVPGFLTDLLDR